MKKSTALFVLGAITASSTQAYAQKFMDVEAGPEYKSNWLHQLIFGAHWRNLWTTPMLVPVLDLKTYAGGLTVLHRGGGKQTKGLRFQGADGKEYKFRSINKDPAKTLPPELRDTLLSDIVKDQISSALPLAPLVVDEFAAALGIYQTRPSVVILPDDPALGEFRAEFGQLLGTIEENPTIYEDGESTFEDVNKIKSTFKIFKRLEASAEERVDGPAYLKARLMDIFIGDWDRHQKQWKWARVDTDEGRVWRPIARDRDQAFVRLDGLLPWLSTLNIRQLNSVTEDYPRMNALTWSGRYVDRRMLTNVSREQWEKVTAEVLAKLTDELISKAVHRLPAQMYAVAGEPLEKTLRARRDKFTEASRDYYRNLAEYVDIRGSEEDDSVQIERKDSKHVRVALYRIKESTGEPKKTPYYERVFDSADTREVRFYGLGGTDRIVESGVRDSDIRVRIMPVEAPAALAAQSNEERFEPNRDYGYDWWFQPLFKFSSDQGLLLGGGPILYHYNYKEDPYVYRMELVGGYSIGNNRFYGEYKGDFPAALRPFQLQLKIKASELDVQNFYGFGNESARDATLDSQGFYKHRLQNYSFRPSILYEQIKHLEIRLGGTTVLTTQNTPDTSLSAVGAGPGAPSTVLANTFFDVSYDTRGKSSPEASGADIEALVSYFPQIFDNPNAFERLWSEAKVALALPLLKDSNISARLGGEKLISPRPYYLSAFLGGERTLRGYSINRFAGDASVYAGAETRIYLTRFKFLFPAKLGVLAFADTGRVFVSGEDSSLWHTGYGGGIWTSFIAPENTLVVSLAHSVEGNIFSLGVGFGL